MRAALVSGLRADLIHHRMFCFVDAVEYAGLARRHLPRHQPDAALFVVVALRPAAPLLRGLHLQQGAAVAGVGANLANHHRLV